VRLVLSVVFAVGSFAATARAEDCTGPGDSVVLVAFTGSPWSAELREGVLEHLRAGLDPTGFRVCDVESAAGVARVATVELRQNPGERVTATIEVRDGVTAKRVARDIDLSALPDDARALGVGVAADELLRASWIELSLAGAPKPATPPPPAVQKAVQKSLRVDRPSRSEVTVEGAVQGHTSGLLLYGGNVGFRQSLGDVLGVGVTIAVDGSARATTPHGSVSATLFGAGASLFVDVVRLERLRIALEPSLWAADVRLQGNAAPGTAGTESSAVAILARAGVALTWHVAGPLLVSVRGGVGAPLRGVVARDYGNAEAGVSGFEWSASAGPGVAF
jgi:hypothetical protein